MCAETQGPLCRHAAIEKSTGYPALLVSDAISDTRREFFEPRPPVEDWIGPERSRNSNFRYYNLPPRAAPAHSAMRAAALKAK